MYATSEDSDLERSPTWPPVSVSVPSMEYTTEANQRQVALKQRGIDKLLEEAREDNKENDAIHLGRK